MLATKKQYKCQYSMFLIKSACYKAFNAYFPNKPAKNSPCANMRHSYICFSAKVHEFIIRRRLFYSAKIHIKKLPPPKYKGDGNIIALPAEF